MINGRLTLIKEETIDFICSDKYGYEFHSYEKKTSNKLFVKSKPKRERMDKASKSLFVGFAGSTYGRW